MKQKIIKFFLCSLLLPVFFNSAYGQNKHGNWSEKMAKTAMYLWNDSTGQPVKWTYDQGVVLEGMANIWKRTANGDYFNYIQKSMDRFVEDNGNIKTYKADAQTLDNIRNGSTLLLLYRVTGKKKYLKAVQLLREQLKNQPRTKEGGFWHKKIYPYQMWLDGLYMAEPFYTEYAQIFHEPQDFDDIVNQFVYMERHTRDHKTGLLYHGWDESKQQEWAGKSTGTSPHFWGRAMGWYGMALVDVLEDFPADHPGRDSLLAILNRFALAVAKVQDNKSGLWYQILDKPDGKGNYHEASASCMFVYALAKGVRLGYLPERYEQVAEKGYQGIIKEFIETDANGRVNLNGTVSVGGLGGKPYRDGSYEYYLSEKVVRNDPKGVGAFLLAANEMELRDIPQVGKGKTIVLDNYFNNEFTRDATGKTISFHYKWDEMDNNGFSILGENARYTGALTTELKTAPTAANLKNASIYIIADPDTEKETAKPNYISAKDISAITAWVKKGGVLFLMGNDLGNAEFDHFNELAGQFGIVFNKNSKNKVTGLNFDMGKITVPPGNPVLTTARQLYLKEISTLSLSAPAKPVLNNQGDIIMAVSHVGKGTVFAVGDPWLYNEYTDGRKLPAAYQNLQAGKDLLNWALKQSH